jgi:D-arabinose 1-dehydrogenase-like Zn-dependent alcohol dehydrogenase
MGKTIAIGRGKDKEDLVKKLGAAHYIDSKSQNTVEERFERYQLLLTRFGIFLGAYVY